MICLHTCVIKRQIKEVSSLHPQCVFQELNLSHLAWWQGFYVLSYITSPLHLKRTLRMESWLSSWESLLSLQKTRIQSPAPAAHYTTYNSNSRESSTLVCSLQSPASACSWTHIDIHTHTSKHVLSRKIMGFCPWFWDRISCYIALTYLELTMLISRM